MDEYKVRLMQKFKVDEIAKIDIEEVGGLSIFSVYFSYVVHGNYYAKDLHFCIHPGGWTVIYGTVVNTPLFIADIYQAFPSLQRLQVAKLIDRIRKAAYIIKGSSVEEAEIHFPAQMTEFYKFIYSVIELHQ